MLGDERCLLFVGQPTTPRPALARAPPLPLAASLAPPKEPPAQPPNGIQNVLMEFLQEMDHAELVTDLRPEFRQASG